MPGVDFVINALFETSGLRCDGACARALVTARQRKAMVRKSAGFTRAIVTSLSQMATLQTFPCSRRPMGVACRTAKRLQRLLWKISVSLVEFAQQLLLQMSPRSLFDRATLGGYPLLLRLTFALCSRFHRLRHVSDLGPARADVSLFWFRVRVHECLALPVGHKNKRNRAVSRHNFIDRRFVVNK